MVLTANLPNGWGIVTLYELAEKQKARFDDGDWIEAEHITDRGVRLVQTGNIGTGKFVEKDAKKYIFWSSYQKLKCKELFAGDLLICRLAEPAGRACVFPEIGEDKVVTSVDVTIFRPRPEVVDRKFLVQYLSTPTWFESVIEHVGGTTHKRIARSALGSIRIPLPTAISEQNNIATVLSEVDALIDGLEKLIAKKRDIKQATMQQLLTGQTRLPGFSGEWVTKLLPDLAVICSGGTPSTNDAASWDGDIAWCTPTDITALIGDKYLTKTERSITEKGLKESSAEVIPAGSIVMTSRATIGECAINVVPMTTNQGFKNFVPFANVDTEFFYYLLVTQRSRFIGLCSGSTFLEIGKAQLLTFTVHLPATKEEQSSIASVISDMDAELATLKTRLTKTRELKQGMMQELLTGRTRLV